MPIPMPIKTAMISLSMILLALLGGCNNLPGASLKGVRLEKVSVDGTRLAFDVEIQNPNAYALPMTGFSYEIKSKSGYLFSGTTETTGSVPAHATQRVTLVAQTGYLDAVVAFEGLSPGANVNYQASVGVSMNAPDKGLIRVSMTNAGTLEVPVIPPAVDGAENIFSYEIDGLAVQTGDLICTTVGGDEFVTGQMWNTIGMLIPGDIDHIIIYIGPGGRCVEEGGNLYAAKFEVRNRTWDARKMFDERGLIIDKLYGVVYPLAGRNLSRGQEMKIREDVAKFCLQQAKIRQPYNFNYLDSETDAASYCSQLAYKAYLRSQINLQSGKGIEKIPGTEKAVYPQEIWGGFEHKKVGQAATD